ncbi:hypothetical protein [Pseudomonas phage vB_PsaM_M1]|nr:hypothetical protein [Pseudomonas phage vB_PsaM_M1]
MNDYPKSQWIFELVNIMSKRQLIPKKDALWAIMEEIEEYDEMFDEGLSPQEVYAEITE